VTQSDAEAAEQLFNCFESTFTIEDRHIPTIPTRITETLSDINISEEAIFYKLLSLNGNKAPGPDALHLHFLKLYGIFDFQSAE